MLAKIKRSATWTKLTNWEYWPTPLVYAPIGVYVFLKAIQTGSPFYYFSANPGIETGGMIIESKYDILKQLPKEQLPKTILIEKGTPTAKIILLMKESNIEFPCIVKPNYGERGKLVSKLTTTKELETFFEKHNSVGVDFIIQEFIDLAQEGAIFYYRYPHEEKGVVSSFIVKNLLSVLGDGKHSIEELMKIHSRANIQLKKFRKEHQSLLCYVPQKGERVELEPIGSHNRGSKFINKSYLITEKMTTIIDSISKHVEGFYYGRYDIRFETIQDVYEGKFKILELNGAKAEPVHIYHPKYPLRKGYRDLFAHWHVMYKISKINHKRGHRYPPFHEGWSYWKKYKKINKR